MTDSIALIGAEDVRIAGRDMSFAATSIKEAASEISHTLSMSLEIFESLVGRMERALETPDDLISRLDVVLAKAANPIYRVDPGHGVPFDMGPGGVMRPCPDCGIGFAQSATNPQPHNPCPKFIEVLQVDLREAREEILRQSELIIERRDDLEQAKASLDIAQRHNRLDIAIRGILEPLVDAAISLVDERTPCTDHNRSGWHVRHPWVDALNAALEPFKDLKEADPDNTPSLMPSEEDQMAATQLTQRVVDRAVANTPEPTDPPPGEIKPVPSYQQTWDKMAADPVNTDFTSAEYPTCTQCGRPHTGQGFDGCGNESCRRTVDPAPPGEIKPDADPKPFAEMPEGPLPYNTTDLALFTYFEDMTHEDRRTAINLLRGWRPQLRGGV